MPDSPLAVAVAALGSETPETIAQRFLSRHDNVVLYGPPGTGKSRAAFSIADQWRITNGPDTVFTTTFHPSYSYEDFVEGFRPSEEDPSRFELTDGLLFRAAEAAKDGNKVLLVIDEINRADVAKVFGELITYVEFDKRGLEFTTAQRPTVPRTIPDGLHILGTMNTADKSISLLDVALRRRFKFVETPPDSASFASSSTWKESALGVDLGDLLSYLNSALLRMDVGRDRLIGQALLGLGVDEDDSVLLERIRFDVYPLVEEYLFGDPARMADVLPGLVNEHGGLNNAALTASLIHSWVRSSSGVQDPVQPAPMPPAADDFESLDQAEDA